MKQIDSTFYKAILNCIHSNILVTNIETDEIVYMNNYMKKTFGLPNPEGKICWQVLQKGMTERCPFCRISNLKAGQNDRYCICKAKNTITDRDYIHYNCLEAWEDQIFYIQNSLDITEQVQFSMEASIDELTGILNRNSGKKQLEHLLQNMNHIDTITVALFDINRLKWVNDTYGHLEGDKLLTFVAQQIQKELKEPDFIFRLSGDEFILVFINKSSAQADVWLQLMLESIEKNSMASGYVYPVSFSYGFASVNAGEQLSVSDILSIADTRMYMQKRDYHIKLGQERLKEERTRQIEPLFQYNKDALFDALSDSIDDYVFVGNLKTGAFIYSYQMMVDFALPSQVVENAAAFWSEKIHPDDMMMFLRSNQEIADGRAEKHAIVYRAKHANGCWTHLMCKGKMIRDQQGKPDLFAGIIRNLDKEKGVHDYGAPFDPRIFYSHHKDIKRAFYFMAQTEEQERLKTEMRLLHFVNRNIPGGVLAVYDEPGYPMYCFNQAILEYTRYSYDELMAVTGGNFCELIHKADQQMVSEEIARQLETKNIYEVRYRLQCNGGAVIWVYERGRRAVEENGKSIILSLFLDISQEIEHEQALYFIRGSSTTGFFKIACRKEATVLYANDGYYQIHGYTKEQLQEELQNQAQLLIYEKDLPDITEQILQKIQMNEQQFILEYRIRKRDNTIAWVHIDACLMMQQNGSAMLVGVLMDITERRTLEEKLRRTERLFTVAKEQSRLNMWELDMQNHRIYLTEHASDTYGFEQIVEDVPESLIKRGFVHSQSIAVFRQLYQQMAEGQAKASAIVQVKGRGLDQDYCWEKITYLLVQNQDEPIWAIGVSEDVTAQKEAEIRVFEEEAIQKLLTEDLLFRFRFNLSQNVLENIWADIEGVNAAELKKGNYTLVFQRILDSMVYEGDKKRFQTYYTLARMREFAAQGEVIPDFEFRRRSDDGTIIWVVLNLRIITSPNNGDSILIGFVKNIDLQKKRELALQKKAEIDEISGLYNYTTVKMLGQNLLEKAAENNLASALLLLDVDDFHEVNHKVSFLAGDAILQSMGNEIRKRVPASCIAGRVSGDVFLLFYHGMQSEHDIYVSAEHIRQALCREYQTEQYIGSLKVTAGIAYRFSECLTFDQLYQFALYALETAKHNGKNQLLSYREVEYLDSDAELELMSDLDDYKVVSMNVTGQIAFGLGSLLNTNLKCYELLHNRTAPCSFCSNRKLYAENYVGEFFVSKLNKRMYIQERMALKNGKRVRQIRLRDTPFELGKQIGNIALYQFLGNCWSQVEKGKEQAQVYSAVLQYAKQLSQAQQILFFERNSDTTELKLNAYCQTGGTIAAHQNDKNRTAYLERAFALFLHSNLMIKNEHSPGYQQICSYYGTTDLPLPIALIGVYEQGSLVRCLLAEQVQDNEETIKSLETICQFLRRAERLYQLNRNYSFVLYHDQKTGLLNYDSYRNMLKQVNEDVHSSFGMVGVHIVDLKKYNQNFGIRKGDQLLQSAAAMLTEFFDEKFCYRISGARFIALCPDITYEYFLERCNMLKDRIKQSYAQWIVCEFVWTNYWLEIEKQNLQLEEKLQVAVNRVRNQSYTGIDQAVQEILAELQEKIQAGSFCIYLQPKAKTETGKICGAEALIRFYDKEKGVITPARFLPEIEQAGLIRYIDLFVLQDVCSTLQQWIARGWKPFPVSLNFSRATILEVGILEETNRIVEYFGIEKGLIEIEITETISSIDRVSLRTIANRFVENGYRLSVDDFGTDYSNISILYSLNLSSLKLDRSIISDIYHNSRARFVVESIMKCCKSLGINCVAEGVETAEQIETLQQMHCEEIQGYYLNKPLPVEEFERLYIELHDNLF